jgi:hypothetical protein
LPPGTSVVGAAVSATAPAACASWTSLAAVDRLLSSPSSTQWIQLSRSSAPISHASASGSVAQRGYLGVQRGCPEN